MRESEAWTRLERYLNKHRDLIFSLGYSRLGRERFWRAVLFNEVGNIVHARHQAGERQAALEGMLEKLDD